MNYIFFQEGFAQHLHPLTLTKPAFDLILGAKLLLTSHLEAFKPTNYSLITPKYLEESVERRHGVPVNPESVENETVFVNALLKPGAEDLVKGLVEKERRFTAFSGEHLVAAKLSREESSQLLQVWSEPKIQAEWLRKYGRRYSLPESTLIHHLWEFIELNEDVLNKQLSAHTPSHDAGELGMVYGPSSRLIVEEGVEVEEHVIFDTRKGPIFVGEGTLIQSFTKVCGPAYIGRGVLVKPHTFINSGTTVGDQVRLGGEVERSIISPYSNKAHEGFIGHSYVGEWVNIGASTITSDLKDTYGTVRVREGGVAVDSGLLKVGCFIADNVKTSIGTYIYSGRRIGVASHLHSYIWEDVPSFTFYAKGLNAKLMEVDVELAIETQRRMMRRRGVEQSPEDRELLRRVFLMTKEERYRMGVVKGRFKLP